MSDVSGNTPEVHYTNNGKIAKPKADRIKEAITILKKLKELGIPSNEPGYMLTKIELDKWIDGGPRWEGQIDFPRFQRKAQLVLPSRADRVVEMTLFAPRKSR